MTIFASNTKNTNVINDNDFKLGFSGCDGQGIDVTSANMNGVINKVTQQAKDCCDANSEAISDAIDLINTNTENIATNTNDIAANKSAISKNTAAIAKNVTAIASNKKSTTANGNSIQDLQSVVDSLKAALEELQNPELYRVGDIYTTTSKFTTGAQVAKSLGYGTWKRYAEGRTLVGISKQTEHPAWTKKIGSQSGAYEHQLVAAEMPSAALKVREAGYHGARRHGGGGTGYASGAEGKLIPMPSEQTGWKDEPHNNVQPSIVVAYWLRTA